MSSASVCYKCGGSGHVGSECTAAPAHQADETVEMLPGDSVLREVYGDLMSSPDSLCHCVSECLAMGAGIAVLFKQGFGRVDELKAQAVKVGGVAILNVTPKEAIIGSGVVAASAAAATSAASLPRFAYYLVTKPKYFHKPTYGTLSQSLVAMVDHMQRNGITKVAMPELGCGLDGLQWPKVRALVKDLISGKGLEVTVYHYKPAVRLSGRHGVFAGKK